MRYEVVIDGQVAWVVESESRPTIRMVRPAPRDISVVMTSLDHLRKRRSFKTLTGAQKFAYHYVGEMPEIGSWYAVSGDGMCKIEVDGATLRELFPKAAHPPLREEEF